jgi:hypothetical protein
VGDWLVDWLVEWWGWGGMGWDVSFAAALVAVVVLVRMMVFDGMTIPPLV